MRFGEFICPRRAMLLVEFRAVETEAVHSSHACRCSVSVGSARWRRDASALGDRDAQAAAQDLAASTMHFAGKCADFAPQQLGDWKT
jgi:hypothetical protein